jgi:hypothetical protein
VKTAVEKWQKQERFLRSGEAVPAELTGVGLNLVDACDGFLAARTGEVKAGLIAPETFAALKQTCGFLLEVFSGQRLVETAAGAVMLAPGQRGTTCKRNRTEAEAVLPEMDGVICVNRRLADYCWLLTDAVYPPAVPSPLSGWFQFARRHEETAWSVFCDCGNRLS